jgi:antitoxin component of MazEF toxin-antitoxin module
MKQQVMQVGNSIGVTVPAEFIRSAGIKVGDTVEVETRPEKGEVIYRFSGIQQLTIAANFLKLVKRRK